MTENDVKLLFKSMKNMKAKREILKCLEKTDAEYDQICKILYVMENSLDVLSESEREIIQMHLVEGTTWERVITQYEERHGRQNGYSKRTYERLQQKALKRLVEVIGNSEIESFLRKIHKEERYDIADIFLTLHCHFTNDVGWIIIIL